MMNIVLVGFMGTGKTAVGRLLAKEMGIKYISTDEVIEDKERRSINDIFKKNGEPYFRSVEKEIVKKVSELDRFVIDAGGGVVLDEENIQNLKRNGKIVCLSADVNTILERTKRYRHRPLLNVKDPRQKVESLLQERAPFYAKADFTIDTSEMTIEQVAEKIKQGVDENCREKEPHKNP
ncbi:MAG: shikimate kinase [Candidatus Omnitrophica bacterium]|nr:shikimate kinase [Candidatus Omnitrophota bacterium]